MDKQNQINSLVGTITNPLSEAKITASYYMSEIALTIIKERQKRNMTQEQFAELFDVTQSVVSKWENGNYNFTIKNLAKISDILDLNFNIKFTE